MEVIKGQTLTVLLNSETDLTEYTKNIYVYSYPSKIEFAPEISVTNSKQITVTWTPTQTESMSPGKLIIVVKLIKNGINYIGRSELGNVVSQKSAIFNTDEKYQNTINLKIDDISDLVIYMKIGNDINNSGLFDGILLLVDNELYYKENVFISQNNDLYIVI